jgi:DNA-binding response OmpR family regulator
MKNKRSTSPDDPASGELVTVGLTEFLETAARQTWPAGPEKLVGPTSFCLSFGEQPIQLGNVEFRILLYLASRHYHPFTRRAIAEAVTTDEQPVTEETLDEHIASLRDQLGVFYDYVQTVPYVGYRFKA